MVDMCSFQPKKEIQVKQSSQTHIAATYKWRSSTLNSLLLTPAIFPLFLKSEFSVGFVGERDGGLPFRMTEEDFDLSEKFNCSSVCSGNG